MHSNMLQQISVVCLVLDCVKNKKELKVATESLLEET